MMRRSVLLIFLAALLVLLAACQSAPSSQSATQPSDASGNAAATSSQPAGSQPANSQAGARPFSEKRGEKPAAAEITSIPAGQHIVIRLGETLSSKRNNAGDSFSGTVAEPISANGKVLIPEGATVAGTVSDAKALGHFKGGALLSIVLNSVSVNGRTYPVETAAVSHSIKGKGKRSAIAIGGGAGLGALIGGIAGGGKGAAIGAAAGGGAGTAGAAFTGNKEIVLPAETAVSFKLLKPVEIR